MGHNVGKAADNAVQKGALKKKVERSTEQIIKDIRLHLESHLAVTPDDVRLLLAEYDGTNQVVVDGLVLLNKYLTGRVYTSLDDALRNMLQAYVTMRDNQKVEVKIDGGRDQEVAQGPEERSEPGGVAEAQEAAESNSAGG